MANEPNVQSVASKIAEYQRPHHGKSILDNLDLGALFRDRANETLADLSKLQQNEIVFSPFLEIGAGSVQRSVALINNYPVQGVATDISQKSLQDTPYILTLLDYKIAPLLISCDAHYLPFLPNTFNFLFAYQTIHHFQNPTPVLAECYRVLAKNGHLFFNEEPMDSSFRRLLRGNRMLSHPYTSMQKVAQRLGVEKIFWDDGALERSLGMTEARFDLDLWRKALEPFTIIDLEINRKLQIHTKLEKQALNTLAAGFVGGNVRGLCLKREGEAVQNDIRERLICLDCKSTHLSPANDIEVECKNCHRKYPITAGVIRMLPKQLEDELNL
jgi:SAM-dependent methyltransferase